MLFSISLIFFSVISISCSSYSIEFLAMSMSWLNLDLSSLILSTISWSSSIWSCQTLLFLRPYEMNCYRESAFFYTFFKSLAKILFYFCMNTYWASIMSLSSSLSSIISVIWSVSLAMLIISRSLFFMFMNIFCLRSLSFSRRFSAFLISSSI